MLVFTKFKILATCWIHKCCQNKGNDTTKTCDSAVNMNYKTAIPHWWAFTSDTRALRRSCSMSDLHSSVMLCSYVVTQTFQDNPSVWSSRVKQSPWIARPLKMWPTGCPKTLVTTNLHCVISQKSEGLIYTMVEAWNHVFHVPISDTESSLLSCHHRNVMLLNPRQRNIAVNKLYKLSYKTEI